MYVIIIQEEAADYGEGGMSVYDELSSVKGPFPSREAAEDYERQTYPPNPYRTTEVMELEAP